MVFELQRLAFNRTVWEIAEDRPLWGQEIDLFFALESWYEAGWANRPAKVERLRTPAVPVACPIRRPTAGNHGQRRRPRMPSELHGQQVSRSRIGRYRQFLNRVSQVRFLPGAPNTAAYEPSGRHRGSDKSPRLPSTKGLAG
jgi:hypothetical protein